MIIKIIHVTKVWVVLMFMTAVQIAVKIAMLVEHNIYFFFKMYLATNVFRYAHTSNI